MQDIEVGISQDECVARNPLSWTNITEGADAPECMVDVIFNNEGTVRREYIAQRITTLKCGCIIIDGVDFDGPIES